MNYSTSIPHVACNANSPASCREQVTITVLQPNNDYWCHNYSLYCTHAHVHDTHPWNASVWVETDDTRPMF